MQVFMLGFLLGGAACLLSALAWLYVMDARDMDRDLAEARRRAIFERDGL